MFTRIVFSASFCLLLLTSSHLLFKMCQYVIISNANPVGFYLNLLLPNRYRRISGTTQIRFVSDFYLMSRLQSQFALDIILLLI